MRSKVSGRDKYAPRGNFFRMIHVVIVKKIFDTNLISSSFLCHSISRSHYTTDETMDRREEVETQQHHISKR